MKTFKTRTVFRFLSEDFRLCSLYNNVNYGAWYIYKSLSTFSVATCRLACFEITILSNEEKLERGPGKGWTLYNLADGVTALAQLFGLYSDREHALSANDSAPFFRTLF